MMLYYDTGILTKLYVEEPESKAVRSFITQSGEPIQISDLHLSEMTSTVVLKKYRGECNIRQVERVLAAIDEDRNNGVLSLKGVDWPEAWRLCRSLSSEYVSSTGCRTLDTLHVACALQLRSDTFIASEKRQLKMASLAGFRVIDPTSCGQ